MSKWLKIESCVLECSYCGDCGPSHFYQNEESGKILCIPCFNEIMEEKEIRRDERKKILKYLENQKEIGLVHIDAIRYICKKEAVGAKRKSLHQANEARGGSE